MTELGPVAWPPAPIKTERLVLREPEARDRAAVIELFTSPDVGTYIGGPRRRDEFERAVPETPKRRPGLFVVDLDGAMIGIVTLERRDPEHPVHVRPGASEVVLTTQTVNERSMRLAAKLGFTEVRRYEDWGAEQWFGMWSPVALSD
ncbi:GNAT family N-acetyltransferase [Streptomyces sp. PB17]|uniref:GNAT family N-acetyltransferase n=1 Tax=Streptomyces sp. PB17 TaxID=3384158 RepID=UPI0038B6A3E3